MRTEATGRARMHGSLGGAGAHDTRLSLSSCRIHGTTRFQLAPVRSTTLRSPCIHEASYGWQANLRTPLRRRIFATRRAHLTDMRRVSTVAAKRSTQVVVPPSPEIQAPEQCVFSGHLSTAGGLHLNVVMGSKRSVYILRSVGEEPTRLRNRNTRYSLRSATIGSTREARRAGTYPAAAATLPSNTTATPIVVGSVARNPKSRPEI